jgi:hypothetical protein
MANTIISQQIWDNKLAQRLDKSQNWKEVCDVIYSDSQTIVLPYVSAANEPAVSTGLFTSAADRSDLTKVVPPIAITQSTETLQIISTDYDAVYIDYADQAQSNYARIADLGDLLGKKVGERVESLTLGQHASFTNIGDTGGGVIGLGTTAISVSATNIDDIIRGIIEQIQTANGFDLYTQNGGFAVWRPADWTFLMQYMQANGFLQADLALKSGAYTDGAVEAKGVPYMGLYHYVSTLYTTGHVMAGVRKIFKLGLLKSTYGKTYVTETPPSSTAGMLSGTEIHTRLDYGFKLQTNVASIVYDVNVA